MKRPSMLNVSWSCNNCGLPNLSSTFFNPPLDTSISNNPFSSLADESLSSSFGSPLAQSSPHPEVDTQTPGNKHTYKTTPNNLRAVIINFQSLRKKKTDLQITIDNTDPDLIFGSETWLDPSIATSEIFPEGYTVYRKDRNSRGGGVLLAIKNSLSSAHQPELDTEAEMIWAKISPPNSRDLYLCSYYRPPKSDTLQELRQSISKISQNAAHNIWVAGDFNCPNIDWPTLTTPMGDQLSHTLLDLVSDMHFTQVVEEPTRGKNVLELFLTTNPSLIESVHSIPGISDHDTIPLINSNLKIPRTKTKPHRIYKYQKADWAQIETELETLGDQIRNEAPRHNSPEPLWKLFKSKIEDIMKKHVPSKLTSPRFSLPWITQEIKKMLKKKQRLYNKARKFKRDGDWSEFRKLRKAVQKKIREGYWKYIGQLVDPENDNQKKSFWKYIKSLNKEKSGISPLKDNGILHTDSKAKAEILSQQFKSVFTKENLVNIPNLPQDQRKPPMPPINITINGVEKLLNNLNPNKASGPDNIPIKIMKQTSKQTAPILTTIFQKSMDTGNIPSDWLKANIVPIYKKKDRTRASNYRPVSLTSVPCKLLEHIISSSIHTHLQEHNILTNKQHGFRQRRSCETSLITTIHDLAKNLQTNHQIDMILLDFSKAFDTVPHQRLLSKLDHNGIRNNTLDWIKHFLTDRTQQVVVEGHASTPVVVSSGVPQGTVLGPLLFLIYINDMPTNISPGTSIKLFADDAMLYRIVNNEQDSQTLQTDLNHLTRWELDWQMSFNPSKCEVMHITRSRSPRNTHYTIHDTTLEIVPLATHLGIDITSTLSWNNHVTKIANKANSKLGFLRRNIRSVPLTVKTHAYQSLVRPHLEYCSPVWDPYTLQNSKSLESVQHRAARFCLHNYDWDTRGAGLVSALGWSTLEQRRTEARLANMYKITHGLLDINPQQYLTPGNPNTRSNHPYKYRQLQSTCSYFTYSYFPRTVVQWNRLPQTAVLASSLEGFKTVIHTLDLTVRPFRYPTKYY